MNKKAYEIFKKNLPATLQLSGIFSAFILLVYGILYLFETFVKASLMPYFDNLYFGLGMIIDFIFVVMIISFVISILSPLVYSYFAANSILQTNDADKVRVGSFLKTYMLGMRHPIKGQLHIMSNLIYAVLIYFGLLLLVVSITVPIMQSSNILGINSVFNALKEASIIGETNPEAGYQLIQEIFHSEQVRNIKTYTLSYGNIIPVLGAFYFFIHRITINILRFYASTSMGGLPAKPLNRLFKIGFKNTKKVFYPDYYKTVYPLIIGFVVVFASIYVGLVQVPRLAQNIYIMNITTITLTAIVLLPFYPIIFNLFNDIWTKVGDSYLQAFVEQASYELNLMRSQEQEMDQARRAQMDQLDSFINNSRQMLDEQRRLKDENNKENKDEKNEDKDENSES